METCYDRLVGSGRAFHLSILIDYFDGNELVRGMLRDKSKLACVVGQLYEEKMSCWSPFANFAVHNEKLSSLEELIPHAGVLRVGRWCAPERFLQMALYLGIAGVALSPLAGIAVGLSASLAYRRFFPFARLVNYASYIDDRLYSELSILERANSGLFDELQSFVRSDVPAGERVNRFRVLKSSLCGDGGVETTIMDSPFGGQDTAEVDRTEVIPRAIPTAVPADRTEIMPNSVRKEFSRFEVDETERTVHAVDLLDRTEKIRRT